MRVRYARKSDLWYMRLACKVFPGFAKFWTTIRLPFGAPLIAYPDYVHDPHHPAYNQIRRHENMHVEQQKGPWGLFRSTMLYFFFPLPFLLSGRWLIAREPYLGDIRYGSYTPESAAKLLWRSYAWPWPQAWMEEWFKEQLRGDDDGQGV